MEFFLRKSALAAQPYEAFLRHGSRQRAVAAEDLAPVETARRRCRRAFLNVKQPFIGTERAVKPHSEVEARQLKVRRKQIVTMWQQGGVQQRHVGRISQDALMQRQNWRQRSSGAEPDDLPCLMLALDEPVGWGHRPELDRAHAQEPVAR